MFRNSAWIKSVTRVAGALFSAVVLYGCGAPTTQQAASAPGKSEARNMRLVGFSNLQARSAYQPVIDDRGYVYIVDRASTGLHILELTGAAREIAVAR